MKKVSIILFATILLFFMSLSLIQGDGLVSNSERRKLEQFPEFTIEGLFNGEFMSDFEKYALDQFAFREVFRSVKAETELAIFHKKDVNDIYEYEGHLIKFLQNYNEESIYYFSEYIQKIIEKYELNENVYYSIIPDKNYFVEDTSYPTIDYTNIQKILEEQLEGLLYIDVMDLLVLDDYYQTDTHWRQEKLLPIIQHMFDVMEVPIQIEDIYYSQQNIDLFKGVYAGQSALSVSSEILSYLVSPGMRDVIITNYEFLDEDFEVYDLSKIGSGDDYNLFLSGASPLIEIVNEKALTDKEIVIFRDSFASSLAPLLIDTYAKITLVDTRYMSYEYLDQFIEFDGQDVLFMYNTAVINNSQMLK